MPAPRSFTPGRIALLLSLIVLATASACSTAVRRGPDAGLVAQLSVERFLDAANQRDLETMGRLFGTADGAAMDTGSTFKCFFKKIGSWFGGSSCVRKEDVEIRMDAIARVLRHDDYRIAREEAVAGRLNSATRIFVDFTVRGTTVRDVPFVVVRASAGRWLVEEIDLQKVMARGSQW